MAQGTQINEENYRALQREIINTQNKLSNLKNEASNWTKAGKKIEEIGTKIESIGNKVDKLGNKLTKNLTVPIVGAATLATKEAVEFESAFAGVEKTVDGTEQQLKELKKGIQDMSKELPSTTTEISAVAEAAGQLGIKTENILGFSKAMIDLGNSTNLTADEAASQLAKFANIMQMSQKDFDKLGSAIVDLGNNYATTEADIVNMSMRLAGSGKQVGLSEGQVLGLATALSSVGIEAEMGGSALSKAMIKMQNAVDLGGTKLDDILKKTGMTLRDLELMAANDSKSFKEMSQSIGMTNTEVKQLINAGTNLEDFAKISGMSAEQFKKAWKEDASGALTSFIKGLGDAENKGESAITMLSEMGLTEVRLRDSLLRAANAGSLFNDAIKTGTKAWNKNIALTNEANKRYATTESQLKIAQNRIKNVSISLGNKLLPAVNNLLKKAEVWIDKLDNLNDEEAENIIKIGLMVAAAGPLVKILGTTTSTIGTVTQGIGTFTQAISLAKNGIGDATGSAATLAKVFQGLTSPAGLAATGITAAVGAIVVAVQLAEKDTKEAFSNMGNAATEFYKGIQTAEGYLDSFNSTLFASTEEQEDLQKQMNEIQEGITKICKKASDERRNYTKEEVQQLDEYFEKLRELKNREIQIYQERINAITQLATTESETSQVSLAEYEERAQQWIKTAQEQAEELINVAEKRRIESIAALNSQYTEEQRLTDENHKVAVENAEADYQAAVDAANKKVGEVSLIYAEGYLERTKQEDGFYSTLEEYLSKQENLEKGHAKKIEQIKNGELWYVTNTFQAIETENQTHAFNQKDIWAQMYKDMDKSQEEQLGVWLAKLAQTELYGNKIDDKTKKIVDSILDSYDSMPNGTKKAMENAMSPMLSEMQKSQPVLFAKASGIAEGILSRLKKAFDIHSPSKETRSIFENVMKGAELGLEDEERNLNKQVDEIANKMKGSFNALTPNMGAIKQSVIDQTKTVFTTPQIVFNVQELDEAKLNQCFNYINRKFGSQY